MKTRARLVQGGRVVEAYSDADWALAYEKRPAMYCREGDCTARVCAKQRGRTRFFAFSPGHHCDHHADDGFYEVPESPSPTPVTPETKEHRWLADWVNDLALRSGYASRREVVLNPEVRADVFVEGVPHGRIEIQRGPTPIDARSAAYSDVLWLLRRATSDSNSHWLWTHPCVDVLIANPDAGQPATPWLEESATVYTMSASSTVFRRNPAATTRDDFFVTRPIPLLVFLRQVWSGDRTWAPPGRCHGFAGWVLQDDLDAFDRFAEAIENTASTLADDLIPAADPGAEEPTRELCEEPGETSPPATLHAVFTPPVPALTLDPKLPAPTDHRPWWRRAWNWITGDTA